MADSSNKFITENDFPMSYEDISNDEVFSEWMQQLSSENEGKEQSASNKEEINEPPVSSDTTMEDVTAPTESFDTTMEEVNPQPVSVETTLEIVAAEPNIESTGTNEVIDALPLSYRLQDEAVEVNPLAIVLYSAPIQTATQSPPQTRSRLRKSVVVDTQIRNFRGPEIFNANEFYRAVESVGKQNVDMLLEDWKVEIRQRPNGKLDKVYRHPKTSAKKIYRSVVEAKTLIRNKALTQNNVLTNDNADKPLKLGSLKRKRDEASTSRDAPGNSRQKVEKLFDGAHKNLLKLAHHLKKV